MTSENTDSDSTSTGGGTPDFKKIDKIVFRYSLDGLREDMKRLYEDEGKATATSSNMSISGFWKRNWSGGAGFTAG